MKMHNKTLGGILLVTGTTIGAGMLALPVCTGLAGFGISTLLFITYWAYMTFTALLFLEVNLWMDENANIISMAKRTLGPLGQLGSWIIYLFLLYSLTTAYIAGGSSIFTDFLASITGITFPAWVGTLPLLLIFGYFIFQGTKSVDYINRILMIGFVVTFLLLIILLAPNSQIELLMHVHWKLVVIGVSIVATSFGFHIIIPTLTTYLDRDIKKLRKVILIGSTIPLCIYILWNFLTLGIIHLTGELGLEKGYLDGANGTQLITHILNNPWINLIARTFSFFAIITSFLGVSLSLIDFLADGIKINKTFRGKSLLYFLAFFPPLMITLYNPRAFLTALEYAGAFGVVLLLGVLPALMIWRGRYFLKLESSYQAPGGKPALVGVFTFSGVIIALEIANRAGWLNSLLTAQQ